MSRLKEKSFLVLLLVFLLYFTLNIIEANITYCAIDDVECHKRMKTSSIKDVLLKKSTPNNYCSKNDIKCQKSSKTKQYNEEVRRALKMDQQKDSEFTPKIRKKRQTARQNFQTYAQNLDRGDYDMRVEEGWTNILYPFGRWVQDEELMGQAGREKQANLGFDCPYFGYRFNYTFVYPMGFVSFATPSYALPPYTFPNPEWPKERDHSFIAPYYADAAFQRIGSIKISNVFYRSVHRPRLDDDEYYNPYDPTRSNTGNQQTNTQTNFNPQTNQQQQQFTNQNFNTQQQTFAGRKKRQMPGRTNQPGMVIDPQLLDNITNHVQDSYTGANGWRAEHAFIVTWFRMSYGGAPRALDVSQFDYVKDWQNTFQLVIATDEIRTFAIFNYARLNWTSSTDAGGLNGFGGNPAYSGFNGGNGTGYYPLPYSGEGRIWKLGVFSNGVTPGRWIHRVDEVIVPAGCTNASTGGVITAPPWSISLGGGAVNVSGKLCLRPCLREKDAIKVSFESWVVDCKRISVARARCVVPMFHKTGLVDVRLSRDGGASYPFVGKFYIISPHRAPPPVKLIDDVEKAINRWNQPNADVLSMAWQNLNLTWSTSARIDVTLWGYWEDADKSHFEKVFVLAKSVANSGSYNFKPAQLTRNMLIPNSYDRFQFGFVQVALTDNAEHGAMWSKITPFPWLNLPFWKDEHGDNWAINLCIEWFEYDGKRRNFVTELTWASPCPCKLEQALLDLGRYMPIMDCDEAGDTSCPYNKGARHCIQSVHPTTTGSSQQCCYDPEGYLMFSDDVEPSNAADYARFCSD